jgi:hypothetical protein
MGFRQPGTAHYREENIMASKSKDPKTDHRQGEGFGGIGSLSEDPVDDAPKSSGFLNQGDQPVPEKDESQAPRK